MFNKMKIITAIAKNKLINKKKKKPTTTTTITKTIKK